MLNQMLTIKQTISFSVEHILFVIYNIIPNDRDSLSAVDLQYVNELYVWPTRVAYYFFVMIRGTFIWSYVDVFIMMISIGLVNLFKQLNNEFKRNIEQAKFKVIKLN